MTNSHTGPTAPSSSSGLPTPSGGKWRVGLLIGLLAATAMPIVALAQSGDSYVPDDTPPTTVDDGYVTTTTSAERSLDVSAFSPICIGDAPFINYTIVPVGFTPVDDNATLVIKDRDGNVIETLNVTSLSGQFVYPGAAVDAAGNATDWPGWKRADDGVSWIPDPSDASFREGLIIEVTVDSVTATATVSYPGTGSKCAGPPSHSLDVSAFAPTCIAGAPFIEYKIVPINFTSTGPATLSFYDVNANLVEETVVPTLAGRIIYPGASVDANGNPTDWPGWMRAADGSWTPDTSDAILREGLTVKVLVDSASAVAKVSYPASTTPCANPPEGIPPTTTTAAGATTTVCVPGQNNDGTPNDDCQPCVPGQNGDSNPADDCQLPTTGGGPGDAVIIGAGALLAGLLLLTAARRRRRDGAAPQPG